VNTIKLSRADAARLLTNYHFRQADARTVLQRLGSVQFDPLNPLGRNHDLVLQARVPGYRVHDWEQLAYSERLIYDAWDKQASLVLTQDWSFRRIYHSWHARWWEGRILTPHQAAIQLVLDELRERGPLTSSEFYHQPHVSDWEGSWYGPKLTKNILRALWHTGEVMTHSRKNGHHVYDLTERVLPAELLSVPSITEQDSLMWLIRLRHRAVGLLRPGASSEVWSMNIPATDRKKLILDLLKRGELVSVDVDGITFHALPEFFEVTEPPIVSEMRFLAPLDQLMWDRRAVAHIFGFDYLWEVYKKVADRKWGYYVLPVMYGDRFVARFDARLKGTVLELYAWYWEKGVTPNAEMLRALEDCVAAFMQYLNAERILLPTGMDAGTRKAWRLAAKCFRNR
jgi:uncharacterized protein YcaQ